MRLGSRPRNKVFGTQIRLGCTLRSADRHRASVYAHAYEAQSPLSTSSLTGSSSSDHELCGWQQYFQDISETERQFGNCNADYANSYAIEFCILSYIVLRSHTHEREARGSGCKPIKVLYRWNVIRHVRLRNVRSLK